MKTPPTLFLALALAALSGCEGETESLQDSGSPAQDSGVSEGATLSRSTIEFGRTVVGETYAQELSVENRTTQSVQVRVRPVAGPESDDYSVSTSKVIPGSGLVLEPGDVLTVTVTFTPARGIREAELVLQLCKDGCPASVAIHGFGLQDAFECTPTALDFGPVNAGACVLDVVTCTNRSDYGATIVGAALEAIPSTTFTVSGPTAPTVVAPQMSETIDVLFCPTGPAPEVAALDIAVIHPDPLRTTMTVPLAGRGGGPDLQCTPSAVSFSAVGVGQSSTRRVRCLNVGDATLDVLQLDVVSAGEISLASGGAARLEPQEELEIALRYAPIAAGAHSGTLEIASDDRDTPVLSIPATGEARLPDGCALEMAAPSPLDFGSIRVNGSGQASISVKNVGTAICTLSSSELSPDSASAYALITPSKETTLSPGELSFIDVAFAPLAEQTYRGAVELITTDLTRPSPLSIELTGRGGDTAYPIIAGPSPVDFRVVPLGCAGPFVRPLRVSSRIASVTFTAEIESGSAAEFTIGSSSTSATFTLAPNTEIDLDVTFAPLAAGSYRGRLLLTAPGEPPIAVTLYGRADAMAHNSESFVLPDEQLIDILLVVDNSGSMLEEQAALSAAAGTLIARADASRADYHFAVTTTDPGDPPAPPLGTLRGDPAVISRGSPTRVQDLAGAIDVGTSGSSAEFGLAAAAAAVLDSALLDGPNGDFLRPNAELVVLVLSDEDDSSPGRPEVYADLLLARPRGLPGAVHLYSISGGAAGCSDNGNHAGAAARYLAVEQIIGGFDRSICDLSYVKDLEDFGDLVFDPPPVIGSLGAQPARGTVEVFIDEVPTPARTGTVANWKLDLGRAQLLLDGRYRGPARSTAQVEYDVFCVPPTCGNGSLDLSEECDDGDAVDTDFCPSTCYAASCGDGFLLAGVEQCDDHNNSSGDGCDACVIEGCGNGVLERGEECDDGSANSDVLPDACRSTCVVAFCGDGVADSADACDDGNSSANDACISCQLPRCGDGILQFGAEQCDDGNLNDADICDNSCRFTVDGFTVSHFPDRPLTPNVGGAAIAWPANTDDVAVAVPIGFDFDFLGTLATEVLVVSNGYIQFESPTVVPWYAGYPNPAAPNSLIAWWWTDLDFGQPVPGFTTSSQTALLGTAPNRVRVLTLVNVPRYRDPDTLVTVEIRLYETSNIIEVHYGDLTETTLIPRPYGATAGWESPLGVAGGVSLSCEYCTSEDWPTSTIVRYAP